VLTLLRTSWKVIPGTSLFSANRNGDASLYNISGECDYIINQPYAPLEKRLKILTSHLQQSGEYYKAAITTLHSQPGNILKWPFSKTGRAICFWNSLDRLDKGIQFNQRRETSITAKCSKNH